MIWTTELPIKEGWYWYYNGTFGGSCIYYVSIKDGTRWCDGCKLDNASSRSRWAGPIIEPSGELPEPDKKQ